MSTTSTAFPQRANNRNDGLLVVEADGTLYGIEGELLREIVPLAPTMRVPGAPSFVRGIMNVRGTMLTVLDLPMRLRDVRLREETASVVVVQGGGRLIGLAVDDVLDVQSLGDEPLEPAPLTKAGSLSRGLGHFGDRVVIVIDVNELARQVLA